MFHKRCDKRIAYLEKLLDEEREKNTALQEQIVVMAEKPVVPVGRGQPADVYYMDDERMRELEESGRGPA